MNHRYSMVIEWSDEDQRFLVTLPEFADRVMMPCADGKTYEEAARNGHEVIEALLDVLQEDGEPLPQPRVRQVA